MPPQFRWKRLRTKIIAWSFVPTAIILIAVALVTFFAYQQVTENLVLQRNQELTRLSAGQLITALSDNIDRLDTESRVIDIYKDNPGAHQESLARAKNRLVVFDGGVIILDTFGTVLAAQPERPEVLGQNWSDRSYIQKMQVSSPPAPVFSNIVTDGPNGTKVIVLAVPVIGSQGELKGAIAGMFKVGATAVSTFYGDIVKLRIGEGGSVYLVDGNGQVIYHANFDRIGDDFSTQPVVQQVLAGKSGAIRTNDPEGRDIVAGFAPVPGTSWGLVIQENWSTLIKPSQGYRLFLLVLLALGVVIPAIVVAIGVERITKPITDLSIAAREVASGNFSQTITAKTGDEIENLADQFNLMASQLQESYAHLEQRVNERTKELAALNTVAMTVSRSLELEPMLTTTLSKVLKVLKIEAGAILLKNEKTDELKMVCHHGLSEPFQQAAATGIISAKAAQSGKPIFINNLLQTPDAPQAVLEEGFLSVASIPLLSKEQVQGVLTISSRELRHFSREDSNLLLSIGHQIGVAIENARLYDQAQQMGILEERQRLARELHDSVTQALYGVTLYAEAAIRLLSSGETAMAANHLGELQNTAQEALKEMRLLIFELRPSVLEKEGLVAALQTRLESVEERAGLKTDFKMEGEISLSFGTESELYRIAQESLNNALKHAQAHRISVILRQDEHTVSLKITDDGVGFDPETIQRQGGLGLPGIKERVARLAGQLSVESEPGAGTTIKVEINQ